MVVLFGLCRGSVAERFVESLVVPPVDPAHGVELDLGDAGPCGSGVDEFGLVEPVDGLCQGIVASVTSGPDGGVDPGIGQALGVAHGPVLAATITVMDQAVEGVVLRGDQTAFQ